MARTFFACSLVAGFQTCTTKSILHYSFSIFSVKKYCIFALFSLAKSTRVLELGCGDWGILAMLNFFKVPVLPSHPLPQEWPLLSHIGRLAPRLVMLRWVPIYYPKLALPAAPDGRYFGQIFLHLRSSSKICIFALNFLWDTLSEFCRPLILAMSPT